MSLPEPSLEPGRLASDAQTLGCTLDSSQVSRLIEYFRLLSRWNQVHNLTAAKSPGELYTHHLLDSLSAVGPLRRHGSGRPLRLLDVGSGGGLPGAVLAIAYPELRVTCLDAVAKKVAFITQAQAALRIANLEARHQRAETWRTADFDVITSRAVGPLAELVQLTGSALKADGVWMAMKGSSPTDEIAAVRGARVFHVEPLTVPGLNAQRCLVWMRPQAA